VLQTVALGRSCRLAAQPSLFIPFGSDAHAPNEVGLNFAEAVQLAHSTGYTHFRCFTKR
jgi:histidinol-phosphatase (PHP family)